MALSHRYLDTIVWMDGDGTKGNRCYRLGGTPFLHWIVVSTAVGSQPTADAPRRRSTTGTNKYGQRSMHSTGTLASKTQTNAQRVCLCVNGLTRGQWHLIWRLRKHSWLGGLFGLDRLIPSLLLEDRSKG